MLLMFGNLGNMSTLQKNFQVVKYISNLFLDFTATSQVPFHKKEKKQKKSINSKKALRTHCREVTSEHTEQSLLSKWFEGGGKRFTSKSSNQRYQRQHSANLMLFDTRALEFVEFLMFQGVCWVPLPTSGRSSFQPLFFQAEGSNVFLPPSPY